MTSWLEHCGANVLLYLVVSTVITQSWYQNKWAADHAPSLHSGVYSPYKPDYTMREWEYVVVLTAGTIIGFTRYLHYMASSSRK